MAAVFCLQPIAGGEGSAISAVVDLMVDDARGQVPEAGGPRPRGRRSRDRPDGRVALIAAATEAFARIGYDGASLRDIARVADVDPGLVRIHFGTKEGLWLGCVDAITAEATEFIAQASHLARAIDTPLAERLPAMVEALAAFALAHPNVRKFVAQHASESTQRARLLTERLVRPTFEALHPLIEDGMAQGYIRVSHPAVFFALLHNAVNRPLAAPVLLNELAPDIALDHANNAIVEGLIKAFLHLPPAPGRPRPKSRQSDQAVKK